MGAFRIRGAVNVAEAEEVRRKALALGQGHLFEGWSRRSEEERRTLDADLAALDWDLLPRLLALARGGAKPEVPRDPEPAEAIPLAADETGRRRDAGARARGEAEIRTGRCAVMMVAGGQGTRLGFDGPKGAFKITPVLERTIFELHADRIAALERRHGVEIPWVIMTSPGNDGETQAFFEGHGFLGRPRDRVLFMVQGTLPAADFEGRLLLASPGRLALSPDGHGGALDALRRSGAGEALLAGGVRHLYSFQVDNVLIPVADPALLGHHLAAGARMSTKCVVKRGAAEPVGVAARWGGGYGIIEYSDLPDDLKAARETDGRLRFRQGSIATHWLDLEWALGAGTPGRPLPFHLARKRVPCWDPGSGATNPDAPNAFKFERFLFDALRHAERAVFQEVDRGAEFSPVKNLAGEDSAESARADLNRIWSSWLRAAGIPLPEDAKAEVLASFALDGDECIAAFGARRAGALSDLGSLARGAIPGVVIKMPS